MSTSVVNHINIKEGEMKKLIVVVLLVTGMLFCTRLTAFAAPEWVTNASVVIVGTLSNGTTWVKLTDETGADKFSNYPFICANASMDKQVLATILTAVSMTRNLSVYCDYGTSPGKLYIVTLKAQ